MRSGVDVDVSAGGDVGHGDPGRTQQTGQSNRGKCPVTQAVSVDLHEGSVLQRADHAAISLSGAGDFDVRRSRQPVRARTRPSWRSCRSVASRLDCAALSALERWPGGCVDVGDERQRCSTIPRGRRGGTRDGVEEGELPARSLPRLLQARPRRPVSGAGDRATRIRRLLREPPQVPRRARGPRHHRCPGRVPALRPHRARRAGGVRNEDPRGLRGAGIHPARVRARHGAGGELRREHHGAALRAPVDRRAAAAAALRHRGAEAQVPAALRARGHLRLRSHGADRGLGSGADHDLRRADAGRSRLRAQRHEALVHQRHAGRGPRRDGEDSGRPHQRVHRRDAMEGLPGAASLSLHGPSSARERAGRVP